MRPHASPPARPLYDRIKQIQLQQGWTGVQLARNAGVDRNTIENWATQPRPPLATTVKSVAERLGIDYTEALELAGVTRRDPLRSESERPTTPAEKELQLLREIRERVEALERLRDQRGAADSPDHDEEAG